LAWLSLQYYILRKNTSLKMATKGGRNIQDLTKIIM